MMRLSERVAMWRPALHAVLQPLQRRELIFAIQSIGGIYGRNEFFLRFAAKALRDNYKNKSDEKLAEPEKDLLEYRTNGSDAFYPIWSKLSIPSTSAARSSRITIISPL